MKGTLLVVRAIFFVSEERVKVEKDQSKPYLLFTVPEPPRTSPNFNGGPLPRQYNDTDDEKTNSHIKTPWESPNEIFLILKINLLGAFTQEGLGKGWAKSGVLRDHFTLSGGAYISVLDESFFSHRKV